MNDYEFRQQAPRFIREPEKVPHYVLDTYLRLLSEFSVEVLSDVLDRIEDPYRHSAQDLREACLFRRRRENGRAKALNPWLCDHGVEIRLRTCAACRRIQTEVNQQGVAACIEAIQAAKGEAS